jgi:uncharacterized protein YidB (DUF937 family)
MGFFRALSASRRGPFLFGGLLTDGAGAALVTTALQQVLKSSRRERSFENRTAESRLSGPVSPDKVEEALGEERIQWLMRQTGLMRDELIAGLRFSTELEPQRFRRYS